LMLIIYLALMLPLESSGFIDSRSGYSLGYLLAADRVYLPIMSP
jgi:hypothetical protein